MSDHHSLRLRVQAMTWQAPTILSLVLETLDRSPLPPAPAGAHLDLRLAPGLARSYSIVGNAGRPDRYEIAVAKDARSRGGSRFVHERLRVGDEIEASQPRNLFALEETAPASVLIAGGIGITPIWAMVQRLEELQRPWLLLYAARGRQHAAYLVQIEALAQASRVGRLLTHFDEEHGGQPADLAAMLAQASTEAHLYCCGPQPMLEAFEAATAGWAARQVHLERFGAAPQPAATTGFNVVLQRSGMSLAVTPDRSILDVVLEAGVNAQYGCMQGTCGMCETSVLEGEPDHRGHLRPPVGESGQERMLICCSRSHSPELVLDL